MEITAVNCIGLTVICLVLIFTARFAVTFKMKIFKPRGKDLEITHQIDNVEAANADEAMRKAYKTLSKEQQNSVTGVYMKRTDKEGKGQ